MRRPPLAPDSLRPSRVYVGPVADPQLARAVVEGGAVVVHAPDDAEAVVYTGNDADPEALAALLTDRVRWVQLPQVGVERWIQAGVIAPGRTFTCARGAFSGATAEHTLALLLAIVKRLDEAIPATHWTALPTRELSRAKVTIAGGGAVVASLLPLLSAIGCDVTVVSDHAQFDHARVVPRRALAEAIQDADFVVVLVASTPASAGLIGASELAAMQPHAWLVNMARGPIVDTAALVDALREQRIGGAALDVTGPEPLPDGHPLWTLPHVIITPHSATPPEAGRRGRYRMVRENVSRFRAGRELLGVVDPARGY